MSLTVKLDVGRCPGCDETPSNDQCVQCYICKSRFHAVCDIAKDTQVGTKTMVKAFVSSASTKSNFKFFCDECLTVFERNLVETEDQKINALSAKVVSMENKLNEVADFMKTITTKQTELKDTDVASYWSNKDGNEMKVPPQKIGSHNQRLCRCCTE